MEPPRSAPPCHHLEMSEQNATYALTVTFRAHGHEVHLERTLEVRLESDSADELTVEDGDPRWKKGEVA